MDQNIQSIELALNTIKEQVDVINLSDVRLYRNRAAPELLNVCNCALCGFAVAKIIDDHIGAV